ncbi:MAG: SpaA isopeptide-forming pilin-related protein [Lachnospiraceae bacterium]
MKKRKWVNRVISMLLVLIMLLPNSVLANPTAVAGVSENITVVKKYEKEDGSEIRNSETQQLQRGSSFSTSHQELDNYSYKGFKIESGELQAGEPSVSTDETSTDFTVHYIYTENVTTPAVTEAAGTPAVTAAVEATAEATEATAAADNAQASETAEAGAAAETSEAAETPNALVPAEAQAALGDGTTEVTASNPISLSITPPSGETSHTILSGETARYKFNIVANFVSGLILVIPISDSDNVEYDLSSLTQGGVTAEIKENYTYKVNGSDVTGDCIVLAFPVTSSFLSSPSLTYKFKNGVTPKGESVEIKGYLYQSSAQNGTQVPVEGGAAVASDKVCTLIADTRDVWSVSKEIVDAPKQNGSSIFTDLEGRSYIDVNSNPDSTVTVSYVLQANTTGNNEHRGRVFLNEMVITDTITGYLPGAGLPTVTVEKSNGEAYPAAVVDVQSDKTTITIPVTVSATQETNNQQFIVKATYNKNAYTKRLDGSSGTFNAPQLIANTASLSTKTVLGEEKTDSLAASVNVAFGYKELEWIKPTLNVSKYISVGGAVETKYTSALAAQYADAGSVVTFTLTPEGEGAVPLTAAVNLSSTDAIATFSNLMPGTYTLSESVGISEHFSTMTPVTVIVSQPSASTGRSSVSIGSHIMDSTAYQVTNTSSKTGRIKVVVEKQKQHVSPKSYEAAGGIEVALYELDTLGNVIESTKKTATSIASDGSVTFENVKQDRSYKIVSSATALGSEYDYSGDQVISSVNYSNTYKLQYDLNVGGFKIGKTFTGADGKAVTVNTNNRYEATFQVFKESDPATSIYEFTVSAASTPTATVVNHNFEPGNYIIKEVGVKYNGLTTNNYVLEGTTGATSPVIKVTVAKGSYDAVPTSSGTGTVNASGVVANRSVKGQLMIKKLGMDNKALTGFVFEVLDANGAVVQTVTMTASESTKTIELSAGTYTVREKDKTGYVQVAAIDTVVVVAGKAASSTASYNGTALVPGATDQQAAVFVNGRLPSINGRKVRSTDESTAISGAVFNLYILQEDGTYKLTELKATSDTNGNFTIQNVPAGTYKLVETTTPAGYFAPGYAAGLYEGATLKTVVAAAVIADAETIIVSTGDYAATVKTISVTAVKNVPKTKIQIGKVGTTSTTLVAGAQFQLYDSEGDAIGSPVTSTTSYISLSTEGLQPGRYSVKEIGLQAGSKAESDYVLNERVLHIIIAPDGTLTSNWEYEGIPIDALAGSTVQKSGDTITVNFSNIEKPDITFRKYIETPETSDGKSEQVTYSGAEFRIYYVESGDKQYLTLSGSADGTWTITGVTDQAAGATIITSEADRGFTILNLDPTVKYYLEEPEDMYVDYEGSDEPLYYPKKAYSFEFSIDSSTAPTKYIGEVNAKNGSQESADYDEENKEFKIVNDLDPHTLVITKKMVNDEDGTIEEVQITAADLDTLVVNAEFKVYLYDETAPGKLGKCVSWITIGAGEEFASTDDLAKATKGYSGNLPVGKYVIVETTPPLCYEADEISVYVQGADSEWASAASLAEEGLADNAVVFEVEAGADRYLSVPLGNQYIDHDSSGRGTKYRSIRATKTGYQLQPDGTVEFKAAIDDVKFDLYAAYKDADGNYVKIGSPLNSDPYRSQTRQLEDGSEVHGEIVTGLLAFPSLVYDAALQAYNAGEITEDVYNYILENGGYDVVFEELGPVPFGYNPISDDDRPLFGVTVGSADSTEAVATIKQIYDPTIENATTTLQGFVNIRGQGALRIDKYSKDTEAALTQAATFEIYRELNGSLSKVGEARTIVGQSAPSISNLIPGYYYIKETQAPVGYNAQGTYSLTSTLDESVNKSGIEFDSALAGKEGYIGPIVVSDRDTVRVSVYDKSYASLQIQNYWNDQLAYTEGYSATYEITDTKEGSTFAPQSFTLTNDSFGTFNNLPDGTYKITGKNEASAYRFHENSALYETGVTVVIEKGVVKSLKVAEDAITSAASALTTGNYVNTTTNAGTGMVRLNVNHKYKGGIVINKGYINAKGEKVDTLKTADALTEATFVIENLSNPEQEPITVTWKYTEGTLTQLLGEGLYKVTETSTKGDKYAVDSTAVYVQISGSGLVYLANNNADGYGVVSSQSSPLKADDAGNNLTRRFYNNLKSGAFKIFKIDGNPSTGLPATAPTNLKGAEFAIYKDNNGSKGDWVLNVTDTSVGGLSGVYEGELPGGTYWVEETKAPSGYSLTTTNLYKLEIAERKNASYVNLVNSIVCYNPKSIELTVTKTTEYNAITDSMGNEIVPASEEKISGVTITLYKKNAEGVFEAIQSPQETSVGGAGDPVGSTTFENIGVGEYRVVEALAADGSHNFLALNEAYESVSAAKAQSILVKYDAINNELYTQSASTDWDADKSELTIENPFIGFRLAVRKVDYDKYMANNEKVDEGLSGAKFEIYEMNGAGEYVRILDNDEFVTDADGLIIFGPFYKIPSANGTKYRVVEVSAPTGYELNTWYTKPYYDLSGGYPKADEGVYAVTVLNKKITATPSLDVEKVLTDEKFESNIESPLSKAGVKPSYMVTLDKDKLESELPIHNLTVADSGLTFYGQANINSETLSEITGTSPEYKISAIYIQRTTAYQDLSAQESKTLTPVWAQVNGGDWKELSAAETKFELPEANNQTFVVRYSSTKPDSNDVTEVQVGTGFTPGYIRVETDVHQFVPTGTQAEVKEIRNTVTASATNMTADSDVCTFALPTNDKRPTMTVSKVFAEGQSDSAKAGDTVSYEIIVKNVSSSKIDFVHPVVADIMPQNMMSLAMNEETGLSDYSVVINRSGGQSENIDSSALNKYLQHNESNTVIWDFPDVTLGAGDSLTITFAAQLSQILTKETLGNTAYATSGQDLNPSVLYPSGAAFISGMGASGTIADGTGESSTQEVYDMLDALIPGRGMFIQSEAPNINITRTEQVKIQKSIRTDKMSADTWDSSKNPVDVHAGDTVSYRLTLQNDKSPEDAQDYLKDLDFIDTIPYSSDTYITKSSSRGTQWTSIGEDKWWNIIPGSLRIYKQSDPLIPLTDYTVYISADGSANYSTAAAGWTEDTSLLSAAAAGATALRFTFGTDEILKAGDSLIIEYDMKINADLSYNCLAANVGKVADSSFAVALTPYVGGSATGSATLETEYVSAILRDTLKTLTGTVWEDKNYDGIQGDTSNEPGIAGATVELYMSEAEKGTDGKVKTDSNGNPILKYVLADTTTTDDLGGYQFTNLKSSYGSDQTKTGQYERLYKVKVVSTDPDIWKFSPAGEGASRALDSDIISQKNNELNYTVGTTDAITLIDNNDESADAGMYKKSNISGYAWYDDDDNGIQDDGELPVSNIKVTLMKESVTDPIQETVTNDDGSYTFSDVFSGDDYYIVFDKSDVTAYDRTYLWTYAHQGIDTSIDSDAVYETDDEAAEAARTNNFTVAYAADTENIDAGLRSLLNYISGRVWEDINYDGIQSDGENPLANVKVYLYKKTGDSGTPELVKVDADGIVGGTLEYVVSDAQGQYAFRGIDFLAEDAQYQIVFENPDSTGYQFSEVNTENTDTMIDTDVVTLETDADTNAELSGSTRWLTDLTVNYENIDALLYKDSKIRGFVWLDDRNQGTQNVKDTDESLFGGITVRLTSESLGYDSGDVIVDASGEFLFEHLKAADDYVLTADKSPLNKSDATFRWVLPNEGADPLLDSDVLYSNENTDDQAETAPITLAYAQTDGVVGIGLFELPNYISGKVWEDRNYDGLNNNGESQESLADNVEVILYQQVGEDAEQELARTTVDANGAYRFDGLDFGENIQYRLEFINPNQTIYEFSAYNTANTDTTIDTDVRSILEEGRIGTSEPFTPVVNQENMDAGLFKVGTIAGHAWIDANQNGIRDSKESMLENLQVELLAVGSSTAIQSALTAADGSYSFTGLKEGTYIVRFNKNPISQEADYLWTIANVEHVRNSDAQYRNDNNTVSVANTMNIALLYGEAQTTWDAGLYIKEIVPTETPTVTPTETPTVTPTATTPPETPTASVTPKTPVKTTTKTTGTVKTGDTSTDAYVLVITALLSAGALLGGVLWKKRKKEGAE